MGLAAATLPLDLAQRTAIQPGTVGYPEVDTYRDFVFYIHARSADPAKAARSAVSEEQGLPNSLHLLFETERFHQDQSFVVFRAEDAPTGVRSVPDFEERKPVETEAEHRSFRTRLAGEVDEDFIELHDPTGFEIALAAQCRWSVLGPLVSCPGLQ
jgi:hypothetical protein